MAARGASTPTTWSTFLASPMATTAIRTNRDREAAAHLSEEARRIYDDIVRRQLVSAAPLHHAVHLDETGGYELLGLTAGHYQAGGLHELSERDG